MHTFKYPKGRILAYGFFFDSSTPIKRIKQSVLELWSIDTRLFKTDLGFALILPKAQPCFVKELSFYPLLKQYGGLSNVVWENEAELPSRKYSNPLWLTQHGLSVELNLNAENQFDPSIWLELEAFQEKPMYTLGKVKKPEIKEAKTNRSTRSVLKDESLTESHELKEVLNNLNNIKRTGEISKSTKTSGDSSFLSRLRTFFRQRNNEGEQKGSGKTPSATNHHPPYPVNSHQPNGLLSKFRANLSNLLMASALGKAIGRAQAKYINNLMDQLRQGNLDDALKDAIPLSNLQDAMQSSKTAMGQLSGRLSLKINPHSTGPTSSVSLGDDVMDRLRKMYENAFTQMDKVGNYKKAAFILAELLRDIDRAVAYLEKHDQFRLAAELAEGQNLPPIRVIRQWILADKVDRAIHIAVISGCYEEAITALEGTHQKQANMLRWHIAQLHFQSGNISSAVDIAWPLNEKRQKIIEWLKESYQFGGALGARHLVRLALNDSDNINHYLKKIHDLLLDQSQICSYSIIDEVIEGSESTLNKRIASITSRAYLLTVANGKIQHDSKRWNQLCAQSGDLTLRADTRNLPFNNIGRKKLTTELTTAIELHFDEAHGRQAYDIAILSNQHYLIAFGESGVELWNSKGKKIQRFSVPCHSIVISDYGTQALLVAVRSGYQVIYRFNPKNLMIQHWFDTNLTCWSNTYDGLSWMVAYDNAVVALDATAEQQAILWRVGDLGGTVHSLVRSPSYFSFYLSVSEHFELWTYRLPNLYLKQRTPYIRQNLNDFLPAAYGENGYIVGVHPENKNQFSVYQENTSKNWTELGFESEIASLNIFDDFLAIQSTLDDSSSVHFFPLLRDQIKTRAMSVNFSGSGKQIIRLYKESLLICHSDGRFIHIDKNYGEIQAEFII